VWERERHRLISYSIMRKEKNYLFGARQIRYVIFFFFLFNYYKIRIKKKLVEIIIIIIRRRRKKIICKLFQSWDAFRYFFSHSNEKKKCFSRQKKLKKMIFLRYLHKIFWFNKTTKKKEEEYESVNKIKTSKKKEKWYEKTNFFLVTGVCCWLLFF